MWGADLPYRFDLPTFEQTTAEREHWLAEESQARAANDELRVRDARAQVEQRTRQLTRLNSLVPGRSYPLCNRPRRTDSPPGSNGLPSRRPS